MLGKAMDRVVAERLRRSEGAVQLRRTMLGIAAHDAAHSPGLLPPSALVGWDRHRRREQGFTLTAIAEQDGVSAAAVGASIQLYRSRLRRR